MATTTQRGYGSAHQRARRHWEPLVRSGNARCCEVVCLKTSRRIKPDEPWDLAHGDGQHGYRGPAHATCNRSEGSRRRWAQAKPQRQPSGTSYAIPKV